jgi:ABC-type spermidine/putrescine transport system permease subunit II
MTSRRTPTFEKLLFALGWVGLAFLVVPVLMIFPLSLDPGNTLRFPPSGISVRWYEAYLTS